MSYLHEKKLIHRDVKAANILITKDGTCKLADFGLAAEILRDSSSISAVGTPYWSKWI